MKLASKIRRAVIVANHVVSGRFLRRISPEGASLLYKHVVIPHGYQAFCRGGDLVGNGLRTSDRVELCSGQIDSLNK